MKQILERLNKSLGDAHSTPVTVNSAVMFLYVLTGYNSGILVSNYLLLYVEDTEKV